MRHRLAVDPLGLRRLGVERHAVDLAVLELVDHTLHALTRVRDGDVDAVRLRAGAVLKEAPEHGRLHRVEERACHLDGVRVVAEKRWQAPTRGVARDTHGDGEHERDAARLVTVVGDGVVVQRARHLVEQGDEASLFEDALRREDVRDGELRARIHAGRHDLGQLGLKNAHGHPVRAVVLLFGHPILAIAREGRVGDHEARQVTRDDQVRQRVGLDPVRAVAFLIRQRIDGREHAVAIAVATQKVFLVRALVEHGDAVVRDAHSAVRDRSARVFRLGVVDAAQETGQRPQFDRGDLRLSRLLVAD